MYPAQFLVSEFSVFEGLAFVLLHSQWCRLLPCWWRDVAVTYSAQTLGRGKEQRVLPDSGPRMVVVPSSLS